MNRKAFLILAVLAVVAVIGALMTATDDSATEQAAAGQRLFPGLMDRVNEVEAVVLQTPVGPFTLQRAESGWTLPERGGWSARGDKVRALLLGLAQAETLEPKTAKPENYAALGVGDPGKGEGVGLEALDGSGQRLASLIVGNTKMSSGLPVGRYVRKADEAQSWLARADLPLGDGPGDWMEDAILHVKTKDVVRVTLTHPDGETWTGTREPADAKHLGVPGVELDSRFVVDDVAGVLSDLTLDDVRLAGDIKVADKFLHRGRFETADGLVVSTRMASLMGEYWLWLEVEGTGAEALKGRVGSWAFKIPAFKGVRLEKRLADLKKKPAEAASPPPAH